MLKQSFLKEIDQYNTTSYLPENLNGFPIFKDINNESIIYKFIFSDDQQSTCETIITDCHKDGDVNYRCGVMCAVCTKHSQCKQMYAYCVEPNCSIDNQLLCDNNSKFCLHALYCSEKFDNFTIGICNYTFEDYKNIFNKCPQLDENVCVQSDDKYKCWLLITKINNRYQTCCVEANSSKDGCESIKCDQEANKFLWDRDIVANDFEKYCTNVDITSEHNITIIEIFNQNISTCISIPEDCSYQIQCSTSNGFCDILNSKPWQIKKIGQLVEKTCCDNATSSKDGGESSNCDQEANIFLWDIDTDIVVTNFEKYCTNINTTSEHNMTIIELFNTNISTCISNIKNCSNETQFLTPKELCDNLNSKHSIIKKILEFVLVTLNGSLLYIFLFSLFLICITIYYLVVMINSKKNIGNNVETGENNEINDLVADNASNDNENQTIDEPNETDTFV